MLQSIVQWIYSLFQLGLRYMDWCTTWISEFLDFYVPGWRVFIISPIIILFIILPFLLLIYLYLCALFLFVYRKRHSIIDAFHHKTVWEGYRQAVSAFWMGHGSIWHGYEVLGIENIPDDGPALLIYYHAALPIDIYYLIAHLYLEKGRTIRNVMDKFAFKVPGLSRLFCFWGSFPGPRSEVVRFLKEGELVSIAPGGVREALFSKNYSLVWQNRLGFARAAIEANVPILPVFTQNCRQAFGFLGARSRFFRRLYEYTRWPLLLMYGGFPVKMTTHIGRPIYCDASQSPGDLALTTKAALESMINTHQDRNIGILNAVGARFRSSLPQEGGREGSEVDDRTTVSSAENVADTGCCSSSEGLLLQRRTLTLSDDSSQLSTNRP